MNLTAFILFLFGLQAICLIVGGRSSKGMKTQDDYFLAGKGVRFFPLMMTFLATQVGGGTVLGSAEEAYRYGWTVLLYPLGASLGMLFLGMGIGRRLSQFKVSTVAQIFEVVYRSPALKKAASLLSIVSLFLIFVAQIIASGKFMVSIGVENPIWFIGFWAIVILYTAIGGLKAVVATDLIQASFFVAVFLFCFGFIVLSPNVPALDVLGKGFLNDDFAFDSSKLYGWLFMPFLFMVIEQDMGQRCFAAESPRVVSKAALWAAFCTFGICVIPVFLGVLGKSMGIEVPAGASVLMTVIKETTSPVIAALVGCAILAAVISTADSLINAISSNLSQDFGLAFQKQNIRHSQWITAGIAVLGISLSYCFNNVVDVMMQSYELSVGCLFIPIFIALFKREGKVLSAGLSIAFGVCGFIGFRLFPIDLPRELATIVLSFIGFGAGEAYAYALSQMTPQADTLIPLSDDDVDPLIGQDVGYL